MPAKRKTSIPESSPEAINENLGKRVKKLRADRGWSLEELATASGVSRSMLSEIEREKANPTFFAGVQSAQSNEAEHGCTNCEPDAVEVW